MNREILLGQTDMSGSNDTFEEESIMWLVFACPNHQMKHPIAICLGGI